MKPEKLKLIIAEGEGLSAEFKEKYTTRIDQDIVAFANTNGGIIILGVNDQGEIVGEKLTGRMKAELQALVRNCDPPIIINRIYQSEKLVIIEIPEGDDKPYSCSSGYFRRLDAVTQKMSRKELGFLFKKSESIPYEEKIISEIGWKDISREKISAFFKESDVSFKKIVPSEVLSSLNLANKNGIKNAGVLFFARKPRDLILQCQMTLVAFKGKDRIHIYDRKEVQDDLLTQFNEAVTFLQKHLNLRSEIHGVNRKDILEIPLEALREAVANAIIHRDYSIRGTSLMVEVHEDRVVLSNPGGLPEGLTMALLGKTNISVRRNELIADMFARMDKVERIGTGIQRINGLLWEAGLPAPEIKSNLFFRIAFSRPVITRQAAAGDKDQNMRPKKTREKAREKAREKILDSIRSNPAINQQELAKVAGLSVKGIEWNLRKLKDQGILLRIGPDKGGHWEIIPDRERE